MSNVNTTPCFNSAPKLLNGLAELKQVSKSDLKAFLAEDHTSFSVLNVSCKHIESTNRIAVTLSKPSAKIFYLGKKSLSSASPSTKPTIPDDCLQDAQNCQYFSLFSSKERRLYQLFLDKIEANFEGNAAEQPLLFLTLTFNTTHDNYSAFTTNWDANDPVWEPISKKNNWLKDWAQNFDPQAEPFKIQIQKVADNVQQHTPANYYLALFLRRIRRLWKPSQWKWVVVSELQKNGIWHFHLLSTPIVPYSHQCTLSKDFKSCWNCRAYISQLWPYGRVESRSPGKKTISKYLAKYLSKSFHLRSLYTQHGLKDHHKTYRFFKNLYEYETHPALLITKHRLDANTGQPLPKNQKVFRHFNYQTQQTTYFYRTNEHLVGKAAKPILLKKNYRLGTRSLNTLSLLKLASKSARKEAYLFKKPTRQTLQPDFQEFLITRLLLLCSKAEFCHLPLEQEKVSKEGGHCDGLMYSHFQTKPVLRFQFLPENALVVRAFIDKLDTYSQEYDMEEAQDFVAYPVIHDAQHEAAQQLTGLCGCETRARNQYLDNWQMNYFENSDHWRRTPI